MPIRSNIAWVDFHPEDMRSARTLIREFQEEGLLDELGFGVLQNAIADRLYPATSTIMTASRYLFFLPAIYEYLEHERTPSQDIEEAARAKQNQLREVLKQTEGPNRGVIGFQAGQELKRPPSNIYWNGMRRLGLFRRNWSESTYYARLDQLHAESELHADDDGALYGKAESEAIWDRKRPTPAFLDTKGNFKPNTDFRLTRSEAQELLQRFATFFPDSLLTYLVQHRIPELSYPWALPRPPASLLRVLRHARALSALAQGVTIQYYALLLEALSARQRSTPDVELEEAFARWEQEARPVLEGWDLEEFFSTDFLCAAQRSGDCAFLTSWREVALASPNASSLFRSERGRRLVRDRELRVKPYKARLKYPAYLEAWNPAFLSQGSLQEYGLFYRHRVGQRFVREIIQGLEEGRA